MTAAEALLMPDQSEAGRFLSILDETAESFCFRVFDDNESRKDPRLAAKFDGTLADVWSQLVAKQAQGCGVYVVANAGEQTNDTIYKVRAVFADTDGAPLDPIIACGLEPHMIVESSPGKWHVYWLVEDLPLAAFRDVQRSIAARFGTDKSVNDLARVMRLPGLLHQKGRPFRARIIHESGALPHSAETILANFPVTATESASTSQPLASLSPGLVIDANRHADVLKCTLLLAQSVHAGAMTRAEAFDTMRMRRDAGRYSRHVPDEEIARALDGALSKRELAPAANEPIAPTASILADLDAACVPFTLEELAASAVPHPHAFMSADGRRGLFPEGEVSILAAPGREGKTSGVVAICKHYALGLPLADMRPPEVRSVLIFSAEDDRAQYSRKVEAQRLYLDPSDADRLRLNVIVPELHSGALAAFREVVKSDGKRLARGAVVEPLIEHINAMKQRECPLGLVVFETASTISEAEEDNPGLRFLVVTLKHIAKATGVAVVLTHHTNQESGDSLANLELHEKAIRGGTALVNNARQTHLVVNLGSSSNPFPDGDSRTLLRHLVAPGETERVTAMVCLSSSKSADPAPLFMRWADTEHHGPRLLAIQPPREVAGKSWLSVRKMLSGAREAAKADKKAEAGNANMRLVVDATRALAESGGQPTAAKISAKCGRNPSWAKPYLAMAVELGDLVRSTEQVPRTKGYTDVYRPPSDSPKPWERSDSMNDSMSGNTAPWSAK